MGAWSGEEAVVSCLSMFPTSHPYLLRLVSKSDKIASLRKKLWLRKKNGLEVLNKYVMQLKHLIDQYSWESAQGSIHLWHHVA